ncbi:hypothetical protein P5673_007105 [Acropora cervicornis]|uniref:Uncharacterized protein n=1 Tax=Acropora cervicornis TaxID=6130 RepID=A0AAD9QX14_ACRCE|nr:hypothetical protein P5673_007105 [Acropora cervicornis]
MLIFRLSAGAIPASQTYVLDDHVRLAITSLVNDRELHHDNFKAKRCQLFSLRKYRRGSLDQHTEFGLISYLKIYSKIRTKWYALNNKGFGACTENNQRLWIKAVQKA